LKKATAVKRKKLWRLKERDTAQRYYELEPRCEFPEIVHPSPEKARAVERKRLRRLKERDTAHGYLQQEMFAFLV
jgi:hypothetical protein